MNTLRLKKIASLMIAATFVGTVHANKMDDYTTYCTESGGIVEEMFAEISTGSGVIKGQSKMFCNFYPDNAFISIGLETFSADEPSIAATYIKNMGEIAENSPLLIGGYSNPSTNVCKNLGGATIGFVAGGGFVNNLGQSDVCVFGDASMVSGWSLIYMANHREGYDNIKNKVKANPLDIDPKRIFCRLGLGSTNQGHSKSLLAQGPT